MVRLALVAVLLLAITLGAARPSSDVRPASDQAPSRALASSSSHSLSAQSASAFGRLPLRFEANLGQSDEQVKFLSRGRGYTLFLTPSEAVMALRPARQDAGTPAPGAAETLTVLESSSTREEQSPAVLRWRLAGADPNAQVRGLDELPGKSNYFMGNDPKAWRTNVPTYGRVGYQNVYPGIDLIYYGSQSKLEYDFVVAPGADPKAIRLAFDGMAGTARAVPVEIDNNGDLILHAGEGEVRLHKPSIYQDVDGVRRPVLGGYTLFQGEAATPAQVGFQIGRYDPSIRLIIDPVLDYSTYLGGTGSDAGRGIAMDGSGNVYVTGTTSDGATFPGPNGNPANKVPPTATGAVDGFVVKLNSSGSLAYSTYFGGTSDDRATGIAVSPSSGTVYVSGYTSSGDFPTTPNAFNQSFNAGIILSGVTDAFVLTLAPNGLLQYSTFLGGTRDDRAAAVAVPSSPEGTVYVTGTTHSSDFPATNAFQNILAGDTGDGIARDAFVAKLDISMPIPSDQVLYATYMGGTSSDDGFAIAVGPFNDPLVVTGQTCSTNFPFPKAPFSPAKAFAGSPNGGCDAFLVSVTVNAGKAALTYSTHLGGDSWDLGRGISFGLGGIVVTGETVTTASKPFPTWNAFKTQHQGGTYDVFVTVLSAGMGNDPAFGCSIGGVLYNNCADLRYSTFLGGSGDDYGYAVAAHPSGEVFVTGQTCSGNFPLEKPLPKDSVNHVNDGTDCDAFVTKFNHTGSALAYSTYLGGSNADLGAGISVDFLGNAYIAGSTQSSNFPTQAPIQAGAAGGGDAFVAKISIPCIGGGGPLAYTGDGSVIDTANDCLLPDKWPGTFVSDSVHRPGAVAVRPDGAKVYGVEAGAAAAMPPLPGNVLVFDTATKLVTKVPLPLVGQRNPSAVAVTPDGTQLFVAAHEDDDDNSSRFYVMNTTTNTVTDTIPALEGGHNFDGLAMHPDGTRAYIAQFEKHLVQVIDTKAKALDPTAISLGTAQVVALAVTPDGKWLYVGNRNGDPVAVIDTANNTKVKDIPVGGTPLGLAVTPHPVPPYGHLVYVATGGSVAVIDTFSKTVVVPAVPGAAGNAVAVTPDGTKVYVSSSGPFVQIIDVATNQVVNVVLGAGGGAVAIAPQDRDGDGIIDQIDGTVDGANSFTPDLNPSDNFTDKHRGGTSSGAIVARNGLKVTVWDAFNSGFFANARDGADTAQLNACGIDVFLTQNDAVKLLCGSLTLDVLQGPVDIGLGGGTKAVVPTGGAVKVTQVSRGQFLVENKGNNPISIIDSQGNIIASVGPGQSLATSDSTPPVTTATPNPGPTANGWNKANVTVTLTATDPTGTPPALILASGVKEVHHSVNVGPEVVTPGATAIAALTAAGIHTITYFAVDKAGNREAAKTLTVKIDKTAPTCTCALSPNTLWPPNHKMVAVTATVVVTDAGSGPAGFVLASVLSNEPDDGLGDGDTPNDIQGWTTGTPDTSGQLRAERSGTGAGRVYTLTYTVMDVAGNSGTCSGTVAVPRDQRK